MHTHDLSLALFGGFLLSTGPGQEIAVPTRKSRGLLAYLTLNSHHGITREHLMDLLWRDRSERQARHSLSQSLSELRGAVNDTDTPVLKANRDRVWLETDFISVDVLRFEQAAAGESIDELKEAASLYNGALLADFAELDPGFDEWRTVRQTELEVHVRHVYARLIEHSDESDERRIELARGLLGLDPYNEFAHRVLMEIHAERGSLDHAHHQFEVCKDLLHRDLGVEPDTQTLALKEKISKREGQSQAHPVELLPSVAVLRFEDDTGRADGPSIVAGLCEELAANLADDKGLTVITSDLSLRHRSEDADPRTASRSLGARYLVTGSVRPRAEKLSILARLVSGETRTQLWSARFDVPADNLFELQEKIVTGVTMHLRGKSGLLHTSELKRSLGRHPARLTAYEHVLRGAMYKSRFTREDNAKAISHLVKAVGMEPGYAWAHAWLAWVHTLDVYCGWADAATKSRELAVHHARRSVALEPMLDFAHFSLAVAKAAALDFPGAEAAYEKTEKLSPNNSDHLALRARFWAMAGEPERGLADMERARELNPRLADWCIWIEGIALFVARRYRDAVDAFARMSYQTEDTYLYTAASHARLGEHESAARSRQAALALNPALCCEHVRVFSTFKYTADLEHLVSSLEMAGLE